MGKILKLFIHIAIFLTISLFGNEIYHNQIKEFDKNFSNSNSEAILRYHHQLKNIYIQSIIQNNTKLKISSLKRLLISSKALDLDASAYEKELKTLGEEPLAKKPAAKEAPKNVVNKVQSAPTANKAALGVEFKNTDVILRFNQEVNINEIKSFLLQSKGTHRYVFDVPGALMGNSRTYESKDIDQIRVAQYDKDTIRIVFSHKKALNLRHIAKDKHLFIGLSTNTATLPTKPYEEKSGIKKINAKNRVIVIDPGHGGKDAGAVNGKYREKEVVLALSLKLGEELKKRGYKVFYTRSKDLFIQLRSRTRIANDKNADLFISVHANAAPTKDKHASMEGVETFFLSPARSQRSKNVAELENKSDIEEMNHFSKQTYLNFLNREKIIASNKFALDVHQGMFNELSSKYKIRDGGVREAPFWVLVGAQMPAILLEIGYITHPAESKRMFTSSYQTSLAIGIANGVDAYFRKNN